MCSKFIPLVTDYCTSVFSFQSQCLPISSSAAIFQIYKSLGMYLSVCLSLSHLLFAPLSISLCLSFSPWFSLSLCLSPFLSISVSQYMLHCIICQVMSMFRNMHYSKMPPHLYKTAKQVNFISLSN